jgi:RNA polymerase-associated protein CTR9
MLASLRAYPRPALSSADTEQERQRAKELYERVVKLLDAPSSNLQDAKIPRNLGDDFDMYIEIARLWQSDNFDRATKALSDAIRIRTAAGGTAPPRVLNNLGVIKHMEGDVSGARELYEQAVPHAMALDTDEGEAAATSILYNLARAYEDQGESSLAREAYGRLLARHPEYIDGTYPLPSRRTVPLYHL